MNERNPAQFFDASSSLLYAALLAVSLGALADAWRLGLPWLHYPCPAILGLVALSCLFDANGYVGKARQRAIDRRMRRRGRSHPPASGNGQ